MHTRPLARQQGLLTKAAGDELLIYDLDRQRAHSLNAVAAALWRACDGQRAGPELAAAVRQAAGIPVTEGALEWGLAALARAGLLARPPRVRAGVTRRQMLLRLGTAAAIPVVVSLVPPTAAHAQSPPPGLIACTTDEDCPGTECWLFGADELTPCPGSDSLCHCE